MQEMQITIYKTSDDKVFEDKADAAVHQAVIDAEPSIVRYVASITENPKYQTRVKTTLLDFVRWQKREQMVS